MCLCWCVLWFIGETRRGNELAQQQHAASESAYLKERRFHTSRYDERKLDKMTTKLRYKNEKVEQIRDAHRKLKDSYGQLKDTLSECKAEDCRLNERLNQKSRN